MKLSGVERIEGVRAVENELQVVEGSADPDVASAAEESDEELQNVVERRLEQRESLADSDIDVSVSAGVVRLKGTVTSQRDRMRALTTARGAKGVKSVIDDLELADQKSER